MYVYIVSQKEAPLCFNRVAHPMLMNIIKFTATTIALASVVV